MQMLSGGPNQASYFPALSKVLKSPHVFLNEASATNGGFTKFTDYSVSKNTKKMRNYRFFTAALAVPDGDSTLVLLAIALSGLFFLRKRSLRVSAGLGPIRSGVLFRYAEISVPVCPGDAAPEDHPMRCLRV
jgi:hypothetical protein